MKTFKYILLSAMAVLGMASCSENEREYFDTNYSALNIWLGTETSVKDSVIYNYSYHIAEGTVPFQVRVTGLPADHDREFVLEAFEGDLDEASESYTLDKYVLPAGEITASFNITFNSQNLKNKESFKTSDGHLKLRVKENKDFAAGAGELSVLNIVLKNDISKPATWDGNLWSNHQTYFGAYSRNKYKFMIETLNYKNPDFTIAWGSFVGYDEETSSISYQYATVLAQYLQQKLEEYNAEHGTIVDDNGNPISFQ